jgi:hypothetical protein
MRLVSFDDNVPGVVAIAQFAVGIIAIGQVARGVIAIGQLSFGVIAIGQVAFGGIAVGQLTLALFAVGMLAFGVVFVIAMLGVAATSGPSMLGFGLFGAFPAVRVRAWLRRVPEDTAPRRRLSRGHLIGAWVGTGILASLWSYGAALLVGSF